jgi:uncharacterized protein (TIGR02145 family)
MTDQTVTKDTTEKTTGLHNRKHSRRNRIMGGVCLLLACLTIVAVVPQEVWAQAKTYLKYGTCNVCRGTGKNLCPYCGGNRCARCNFSGVVKNELTGFNCWVCGGSGKIQVDSRFADTCFDLGSLQRTDGSNTYQCMGGAYAGEEVIVDKKGGKIIKRVKDGKVVFEDAVWKAEQVRDKAKKDAERVKSGVSKTFTDSRDGKTYKTVKIGNHTWMAENLNYKPPKDSSWCYDDADSNCVKYGRLYNWDAAWPACPAGYRLPTSQDWDNLGQTAGGERKEDCGDNKMCKIDWYGTGKKLKSISGWNYHTQSSNYGNGTDDFGFSALPSGNRNSVGKFINVGKQGWWWTHTEYDGGKAYIRNMGFDNDNLFENDGNKTSGFSVRCVQND